MIIFLLYLSKACDTIQYLANITSYASYLPMKDIQQQLNIQFQLPNINGNTSIENIIVNPKTLKYNITQNGDITYTVVYDVSYIVTFLENYQGNYLQGQALLYNSQVTIIMFYDEGWQQQGIIQYAQPQQISQIGLQQYSTTYTNVSNLLNQQLPVSIGQYYNELTLEFAASPSIFDYVYKNVSGQTVTIPLNITIQSGSYSNGLNISRLFFVEGYENNNCTQLTVDMPTNYYQLEIYSLSSIQSIFNYAQSKGYFNAILDQQFKTAEVQFIVGSFQYVIKGLTGQYPIQTTMYGYCEASNPQLVFNQTQNFFANIPYLCSIYNPMDAFSNPMVQINFTLTLNLTLMFADDQIIIKSGTPRYQNKTFVTGINLLQKQQLGNLFFDSVIARQFDNTYVFGSGFPTLSRANPQYTIQNDYLMIYDNLLSNQ